MTSKISPFQNKEAVRNYFNDWHPSPYEYGLNKVILTPRFRNEFNSLYFDNQYQDLFTLRLNWENPNPMKWYVNMYYAYDTFPELFDALNGNSNNKNNKNNKDAVLTIEIDLGYKYPFRAPKMTLMTFKRRISETPIKNGKIKSDGTIEHFLLRELSQEEIKKELSDRFMNSDNPYNWCKIPCWCPAVNLLDIIKDLYIEIPISYQRFGESMFY